MAVLLRVFGIDPDHLEEGYYCMTGAAGCYIDSKNAKCPDWGYAPRNRIISDGGSTTTIAVEVAFSQDNESLCDKILYYYFFWLIGLLVGWLNAF